MKFYVALHHVSSIIFFTLFVLRGNRVTFVIDDIISLFYLLDVEFPSFPIISFEFENIASTYFPNEFNFVNDYNMMEIVI